MEILCGILIIGLVGFICSLFFAVYETIKEDENWCFPQKTWQKLSFSSMAYKSILMKTSKNYETRGKENGRFCSIYGKVSAQYRLWG